MSNQELLHAVVALYDKCLPEITPEVLYPTVCGKWAKTLVLLRDFQGTCVYNNLFLYPQVQITLISVEQSVDQLLVSSILDKRKDDR